MRTFFGVLVLAWSCIVPQVARAAEAPAEDSGVVETLKRLGQEMGDAMVARDIGALDRIFADDWTTVGASGKTVTKQSVLQAAKYVRRQKRGRSFRPRAMERPESGA